MAAPLPCLTIAGPTASGKSELAIQIAEQINGEIIGADAFQIYWGMGVLTAQIPENERRGIPHHLVGCIDPMQDFDVASYLKLAREKIIEVRAAGRLPILVGGTGLYIRAVLKGLAEGLPAADPALRVQLDAEGLNHLVARLIELDPAAETLVDLRNPRRVIRALEVCLLTGRPFTSFRAPEESPRPPVGIWITRPRDELHERIALRTESMFEQGAIEEIASLENRLGNTASQAIGLQEIQAFLKNRISRADLLETIKTKTRQYAKRQETWFKKEPYLLGSTKQAARATALDILSKLS
jgi:tRNA dimethylallyltransferase